jgi:hypothetical protein
LTRKTLATLLAGLVLTAVGCSHEEKKVPTQTYEPPKLRSAAERSASAEQRKKTDERVALRMSPSQVLAIQGKPGRVDVYSYPGSSEVLEEWRYPEIKNGCGLVQFTNARVTMLRECVGPSNTTPAPR